jgi:hypothetical protein
MTENKPIAGNVVKVELVHQGEGWPSTEVTIRIAHRSIPYRPERYVHTWRELHEQQSPFTEYELQHFAQYEEDLKEYKAFTDRLDRLHLGPIDLAQEVREEP